MPVATYQLSAQQLAQHVDQMLLARPGAFAGLTVSTWWPIKAELDLRFWLATLVSKGARAALPVVVARAALLAFRAWIPGADMSGASGTSPCPPTGRTSCLRRSSDGIRRAIGLAMGAATST